MKGGLTMTFKLGDYVKHVEYPKSKVPLLLHEQWHVDVVNAQIKNFVYSGKEEYDGYWEEN